MLSLPPRALYNLYIVSGALPDKTGFPLLVFSLLSTCPSQTSPTSFLGGDLRNTKGSCGHGVYVLACVWCLASGIHFQLLAMLLSQPQSCAGFGSAGRRGTDIHLQPVLVGDA